MAHTVRVGGASCHCQAEWFHATPILLRNLEPLSYQRALSNPALKWAEEPPKNVALEYLDGMAATVPERSIPVEVIVMDGHAQVELVDFVESNRADSAASCTRGRPGLGRWLMESVTDARHAAPQPLYSWCRRGQGRT